MVYSIQCRYSMVQEVFKFIIKSTTTEYEYSWLVEKVDKPLYLQTNTDIIIKSELFNESVTFSIADSKHDCKEKVTNTITVPIMTFESDNEELEIIYDFNHLPNEKERIVGKIINRFLQIAGGGFLDGQDEYQELENNISVIIDEALNTLSAQKNTYKKEDVKPIKTKSKTAKKEKVKQVKQVKAKTSKKIKKA